MIVDCMTCPVRGRRCDDCVVTVLSAPRVADDRSTPEPQWVPEPQWTPELALDAAEHRVVSMFVGAGLVNPGAAAGLRARCESPRRWRAVRDVG